MQRKALKSVIAIVLVIVFQLSSSISVLALWNPDDEVNKYPQPTIYIQNLVTNSTISMVKIRFSCPVEKKDKADFCGFVVQRKAKDETQFIDIGNSEQGKYEYTDMPPAGKTFYYRVAAIYRLSSFKFADPTKGDIIDGVVYRRYSEIKEWSPPPKKPENLKVENTSRGIQLSWEDCSDNEQYFIITKRYSNKNTMMTSPIKVDANTNNYLDSSFLQKGKMYTYKIRAHASGGDSSDTSEVSITFEEVKNNPQQVAVPVENTIYSFKVQEQLTSQVKQIGKSIILKIASPLMIVDGKASEIDPGKGTAPVLIKGQIMVPIKTIIEALGGSVFWDARYNMMTISLLNKKIRIWGNNYEASGINPIFSKTGKLPVPFQTIKGRTYVPIGFIANNLGVKMDWNPKTKTASLKR